MQTETTETEQEKKLVQRIMKGDSRAEGEFFDLYQQRLYETAVYFLGPNDAEIQDVVQQTFISAFDGLKGFEFRSSLYTWLNQICVLLCYRRLKKREQLVFQLDEEIEYFMRRKGNTAKTPEDILDTRQREETLEKALLRLNEQCQDTIRLRDISGLAYGEISRRLKIPLGTVMSRLARCRGRLVEIIRDLLGMDK